MSATPDDLSNHEWPCGKYKYSVCTMEEGTSSGFSPPQDSVHRLTLAQAMADSSALYNCDFNDEDQQTLVQFASLSPHKKYYQCGWVALDNVGCPRPRGIVLRHLREAHGVFGNGKTQFKCRWVGCGLQMNKESVGRHVAEAHPSYTHPCTHCGGVFSHKNTLNRHVRKKHSSGIPS
ncbi:hypothetical protein EDD15DRAFT_2256807 [Pisolithus albus]|nr:hypothetical protein EDD15DRAFT_2256807 [Pisolithus albus]